MATQKVLIREAGITQQYTPKVSSTGAADAGQLVALGPDGKIDTSMYTPGADTSIQITASEAIGAGKFYNLWSDAGTMKARLADNTNNRPADGFVKVAIASSATGSGFPLDAVNAGLTGLTPGTTYYLGTAGDVIDTPLDATDDANDGKIDQKLGKAMSTTELATEDYDYVIL